MAMVDEPSHIELKKFEVCGLNFYLSPRTLKIFHADKITSTLLDAWSKGFSPSMAVAHLDERPEEHAIHGALKHMEMLLRDGLIYQSGSNECTEGIKRGRVYYERPGKSVSLEISSICNLQCTYCFQDGAQRNGYMSSFVGRQSIDFVQQNSVPGETWSINFFGGEALLKPERILEVADYAIDSSKRAKCNVQCSLTTNGTLLNERIIKELAKRDFEIRISLDGDSTTHDKYRRTVAGNGSHARILKNIPLIIEHFPREKIVICMVVTHETIADLEENM